MATVYNTTFQLRRGTAAIWEKNNPILSRGEPGFEIDTNRLKIGDGLFIPFIQQSPNTTSISGIQPQ